MQSPKLGQAKLVLVPSMFFACVTCSVRDSFEDAGGIPGIHDASSHGFAKAAHAHPSDLTPDVRGVEGRKRGMSSSRCQGHQTRVGYASCCIT